jgi:hypothetical protein
LTLLFKQALLLRLLFRQSLLPFECLFLQSSQVAVLCLSFCLLPRVSVF